MPFFHEISDKNWRAMQSAGWTWTEVSESFRAPDWCGIGQSSVDPMGCWSLVGRKIRSERDCAGCQYCLAVIVTGTLDDV